jgi:hypothetical protein
MVEPNRIPKICPNGHVAAHNDAAFCSSCGLRIIVGTNQQIISPQALPPRLTPQTSSTHNPHQPQPPNNQQTPFNQMPPMNGYAQQPYGQMQQMQVGVFVQEQCHVCGGQGQRLDPKIIICKKCNWLRPLAAGYAMDCSAFQYSEDGKAMAVLRSISPLNAAAKAISDKVGRRWVETTLNGVLLGENQLPHIYASGGARGAHHGNDAHAGCLYFRRTVLGLSDLR